MFQNILNQDSGGVCCITFELRNASIMSLFLLDVRKIYEISLHIQGVPKKRWISVQQAVEDIRSDLRIKVGCVLENSGYFLSNEYKNSPLL